MLSSLITNLKFQVGSSGKVYGIDHIPELVAMSRNNISRFDPFLIESNRIQLIGNISYEPLFKDVN